MSPHDVYQLTFLFSSPFYRNSSHPDWNWVLIPSRVLNLSLRFSCHLNIRNELERVSTTAHSTLQLLNKSDHFSPKTFSRTDHRFSHSFISLFGKQHFPFLGTSAQNGFSRLLGGAGKRIFLVSVAKMIFLTQTDLSHKKNKKVVKSRLGFSSSQKKSKHIKILIPGSTFMT